MKGPCDYAMNSRVGGLGSPGDTVLLFETHPGWNQTGGLDIAENDHHERLEGGPIKGCNVLFFDKHVEFVTPDLLGSLRWDGTQQDTGPWTECPIQCPWTEGKVVFMLKHIHLQLPEYDQQIRIDVPDQNSIYCWLPTNTGGRTMINVYWVPAEGEFGPMLLLKDRSGHYAVDLRDRRTLHLAKVDSMNRVFAGEITAKTDTGRFSYGRKPDGGMSNVRVGRADAVEITEYRIYDRSQYIGRIDGSTPHWRFIPASESMEESIPEK